jgi:transcriptional regulator with XRE-family HTH domain
MIYEEFGSLVKQYRLYHGHSQKSFAKLAGCAPSTLCKIESNTREAKGVLIFSLLRLLGTDFTVAFLKLQIDLEYKARNELYKAAKTTI